MRLALLMWVAVGVATPSLATASLNGGRTVDWCKQHCGVGE